jgi:hypothetical protein
MPTVVPASLMSQATFSAKSIWLGALAFKPVQLICVCVAGPEIRNASSSRPADASELEPFAHDVAGVALGDGVGVTPPLKFSAYRWASSITACP